MGNSDKEMQYIGRVIKVVEFLLPVSPVKFKKSLTDPICQGCRKVYFRNYFSVTRGGRTRVCTKW